MDNIANSVLLQKPDRSTHNLTHEVKTATTLGRLTPVCFMEVVPGDKVDINAEFLTKFQPLITPAMQNFHAHVHYFYVPNRILWKNWKYFVSSTETPEGDVPVHPYINIENVDDVILNTSNLAPYFGLYLNTGNLGNINPLFFAAYQLIYNEYFRHEKIHEDLTKDIILSDGDNSSKLGVLNKLRVRTWKDDYFSAALQSPQDGPEAAMELVSNNFVNVLRDSNPSTHGQWEMWDSKDLPTGNPSTTKAENQLDGDPTTDLNRLYIDPNDIHYKLTMNDFIKMARMQEFLIRANLAGNRYNEFILAHFGVRVPDLRIDRPDYICGLKAPVIVSEVLNMAADQGYQTGQANSYSEGGRGNYEVLEHGVILGLYSCTAERSYTRAVQRFMFKQTLEDYYLPILDQMGEQEIENREICLHHVNGLQTFGYVPKYAEYRLPFNMTTHEMAQSLNTWHLADITSDKVVLDEHFFDMKALDRIFLVSEEISNPLLLQVVNHIFINRPMKKYSMATLTNQYGNNIY